MAAFPKSSHASLLNVAKHYDHIAEILEPFSIWEKGKGYQAFMGDAAHQKEHVENVLKPVKREMAAAADEIEKALKEE